MSDPFNEGRVAGYHGEPRVNPYDKGWGRLYPGYYRAARDWEAGYDCGEDDYTAMLAHEKHTADCQEALDEEFGR
jgi:hypothetical protein